MGKTCFEGSDSKLLLIQRLLRRLDLGEVHSRTGICALGGGIDDPLLSPDSRRIRSRQLDFLLLLLHLLGQLAKRSVQLLLLLVEPRLNIDVRNCVGDVWHLIRVCAVNPDLEHRGVAHILQIQHSPELEIGPLIAQREATLCPLRFQPQLLNNWIQDRLALKDLELCGRETRISDGARVSAKHVDRPGSIRLHDDRRLCQIQPGQEVCRHSRRDQNEQEDERNDPPANADNPPIIEKVELGFAGVVHRALSV